MNEATQAGRTWLRSETRRGRQAARPVVALGVVGTLLAILQAGCVALILGAALLFRAAPGWAFAGFAVAALLRAGVVVLGDRLAGEAGAAARRRLRLDAMGRLLSAGPAVLRGKHSAELASTVIDQVDALDGFFARWLPAASLAIVGPVLVLIAVALTEDHRHVAATVYYQMANLAH